MKPNQLKRQAGVAGTILLTCLFALSLRAWGQAPSSRQIPFSGVVTTISPSTPGQTLTLRLLDNSNPPVALYCETQTLDVDVNGAITFILGTGTAVNPPCPSTPPGLNPADFASGSTRSLDVVDTNGNSVLANPIPLTAVAFALSPGPQGPAGPKGDKGDTGAQGQQGPPGVVQAVSPGDASITVAGTAATPSVAVSPNGITNNHIANGALSPAKIAGTAATLGPNNFIGTQSISGALALPNSTAGGTGLISLGGVRFLHNYGADTNAFVGSNAGNLTMTGNNNIGVGSIALKSNTTGCCNTAVGNNALWQNTTGAANTAMGDGALYSNTVGFNDTAIGRWALISSNATEDTAIGAGALQNNSTGSANTALGYGAGLTATAANANTTGSNNTFIGYLAGPGTPTQLTNATAIGANAQVSASNALVLGGTGTNAVNVGIGTATPASTLDVNGTANFAGAVTGSTFSGALNLSVTSLTPQNTQIFQGQGLYVIPGTVGMLIARMDTFDPTVVHVIKPLLPSAAGNPGHILVSERKGTTIPFVLELRGGDLLNGAPAPTVGVNNTLVLVSDGINNWIVIANF